MKNTAVRVTAVAAAALFATTATACSSSGSSSKEDTTPAHAKAAVDQGVKAAASPSASDAASMIMLATAPGLGKVLVDSKGTALYRFDMDTSTKSTCNGECAKGWPPAIVKAKPTAGPGVQSKLLGITKRDDGKMQATYNGRPVYYFAGDTKPGTFNGQGVNAFGAKWWVVDAKGNKVTKMPPGSSGSPSSSSSGGVTY